MGDFANQVFAAVRAIPRGKVATYGQIARLTGHPRSARYVGFALRSNPAPGLDAACIPCHRVVFKDGSLTDGYAFGGPGAQRAMLAGEGVLFTDDDRVDMDACAWDGSSFASGSSLCAPPDDFDWERELGEA